MFGITKKITVDDIKQHLVNEFKRTGDLEKENYNLKDSIKKCAETQIKYDATLVTLDEYKNRLAEKERRIRCLDNEISDLNNKTRKISSEKNDEIIRYKILENKYKNVSTESVKDYKKEVIAKISNLKGNISKKQIIELLKNN